MKEILHKPNRLAAESSPYLRQHADNPVNWYPWCDEAFESAAQEDKPVFLSAGYSTCHWCHVMAHESFEDPAVAEILNKYFISVKLDREERPDIDHLYMSFVQALTGRGGWPMSVFLTPGRKPFFGGTYFPKTPRGGQPGFVDLLNSIRDAWQNRKEEILISAEDILRQLRKEPALDDATELSSRITDQAFHQLSSAYDPEYGGFGNAPKFPSPHHLLFLLRYRKKTGYPEPLAMAEQTLKWMRRGGVFDHIGFGFHRYSTDRRWFLPHFEKMLYDQALMIMAYAEAYAATKKDFYKNTVDEIIRFVIRDFRSPEGGFYSALDADSEGEEGKYYVWAEEELRTFLNPDEFHFVKHVWNALPGGNVHDESTGRPLPVNHFHQTKDDDVLAYELGLTESEFAEQREMIRGKIDEKRQTRIPPLLDDKILTDWNGLMIAALAKSAAVFRSGTYLRHAETAAEFILNRLRNSGGRLLRRYRKGETGIDGQLEDYTFFVWGLIELYEASAKPRYLREAVALTETTIADFWDHDHYGFFLAAGHIPDLILRNKTCYDGAYPSGNSVAAQNLIRLGRMTGNAEWIAMAQQIECAFSGDIRRAPTGYTHLLSARLIQSGPDIIVTGNPELKEYAEMISGLSERYLPGKTVIYRDDRNPGDIQSVIPALIAYPPVTDGVKCYICAGSVCRTAVSQAVELNDDFFL